MDPLSKLVYEYILHLQTAYRVNAPGTLIRTDEPYRLHPSATHICDRKQAYGVLTSVGRMDTDLEAEESPQDVMGHFPGNLVEWFVIEACDHERCLIDSGIPLITEHWVGTADLWLRIQGLAKFGFVPYGWLERSLLVDVKTTRSGGQLYKKYYPSSHHVAQVETYRFMMRENGLADPVPALWYATRTTLDSAMYTWDIDANELYEWTDSELKVVTPEWFQELDMPLKDWLQQGWDRQIEWLRGGPLPPRVGRTPFDHPFACGKTLKQYGKPTGNLQIYCPWFAQCWDLDKRLSDGRYVPSRQKIDIEEDAKPLRDDIPWD